MEIRRFVEGSMCSLCDLWVSFLGRRVECGCCSMGIAYSYMLLVPREWDAE